MSNKTLKNSKKKENLDIDTVKRRKIPRGEQGTESPCAAMPCAININMFKL